MDERLVRAAKEGDLEWLGRQRKEVLAESVDRYGSDVLTWSAGAGHLKAVQFLVHICDPEREAWPKQKGSAPTTAGRRALHFAARHGHLSVVQFLIDDLKCEADPRSENGVTPLQLAVWQCHTDVVHFLLPRVHNPRQRNTCGCSLAHWLAMSPPAAHFLPVAHLLAQYISHDAFREDRNHSDHTPLHKAAFNGNAKLCTWLLEVAGADDDCFDRTHRRPSDEAERNHHLELAEWLRQASLQHRLSQARHLLGIEKNMKKEIIRKAFRSQARNLHPDRNPNSSHAFIALFQARNLLLADLSTSSLAAKQDTITSSAMPDMASLALIIHNATARCPVVITEPLAILRQRILATVLVHGNCLHLALLRPKYCKLWGDAWDFDTDRIRLGLPARGAKGILRILTHPAFLPVLRVEYEGGLKKNRPFLSALVGGENMIRRRLALAGTHLCEDGDEPSRTSVLVRRKDCATNDDQ